MSYTKEIESLAKVVKANTTWHAINPESAVRMRLQNRFKTHLDIAKYNANTMRADMAAYDKDTSKYTQSLGCWHGFIGQQKMISIKKHFGETKDHYLYLSGWMVAALRSEFGPLPDQSMHEKSTVADLIRELYTFLKQADAWELNHLFRDLDAARAKGDSKAEAEIINKIDNFETHVVPIIADIDAGFGNAEATYLMAKQMIEAGACCIQIENQVSDEKQCGHQDGKVTVPHADFLAKINAVRYAFLELGVDDGVIVARTGAQGVGTGNDHAVVNAQFQEGVANCVDLGQEVGVRNGYLAILVTALLLVGNLVLDLDAAGTRFDHLLGQQVGGFLVAEAGVDVGDDRYNVGFEVVDLVQDLLFLGLVAGFAGFVQGGEQQVQLTG